MLSTKNIYISLRSMSLPSRLFALLIMAIAALSASAQPYYVRGVARCILDDGSGTFPVDEAGEVFVSTSPDATPLWTSGEHATPIISGNLTTASVKVNFYYWARAKAGYSFVGWASTKTSTTPSAGTAALEGQAYMASKSLSSVSSLGTEAKPVENARYAIFRKNATEDNTGGGVAVASVSGTTYTVGASLTDWPVRIDYKEALAYKNYSAYSEGYGVNKGLISSITCRNVATGQEARVANALIYGSATAAGTDAHGMIYFPANLEAGKYTVHVPKGLFTTASGQLTAAHDFEIEVLPDLTPFEIASTSPEAGQSWDAEPTTDTKDSDGDFSVVTLIFNKNIAKVDAKGKDILLTNTTTGRISKPTACAISSTANKRMGTVAFGPQASGSYLFELPADVFFDAAGNGNQPLTLRFSVKGSRTAPWELPTYSNVAFTPNNNSTVTELSEVSIVMSRDGYRPPIRLNGTPRVTATKVTEVYEPGVDYNDPDNKPTLQSEEIAGVSLVYERPNVKIRFAEPITEATRVVLNIPGYAVLNVPDTYQLSNGKPTREMYEAGACTNAPIQLVINVKPPLDNTPATVSDLIFTIDEAKHGRSTLSAINDVIRRIFIRR